MNIRRTFAAAIFVSFTTASSALAQVAPGLGEAQITGNSAHDFEEARKQGVAINATFATVQSYQDGLTAGTASDADQKKCSEAIASLEAFVTKYLPSAKDPEIRSEDIRTAAQGLKSGNQQLAKGVKTNILNNLDVNPCPTVPAFKKFGNHAYNMAPTGTK